MSLQDAGQLSLAQPVQLTFTLPSGCPLRVGAVVWWKRDDLTGLRFDPRDDYPAIAEWIKSENDADPGDRESSEPHSSEPNAFVRCVAQKG